ncbi:hypothetical protein J7J00_00345 [Bacillus sp. ISL-4]|nr:hypothetical protein [Bacillus sp. ISL-4]MBT2663959.1 hypothetical protein [Bacillus sp. ISL-4]MBT2672653.1 hypothetical protein [Streptomyces sp. ISL-14]
MENKLFDNLQSEVKVGFVFWEYTRLGLLPESEYDKRILEEYLKKE